MNRAAFWLFNHREPRPFACYRLRWRGRQNDWPYRSVSGYRSTTEESVLDDVAQIFRDKPHAQLVILQASPHATSLYEALIGGLHARTYRAVSQHVEASVR